MKSKKVIGPPTSPNRAVADRPARDSRDSRPLLQAQESRPADLRAYVIVRTRFFWSDQTEATLRDKDSIRIGLFTDERTKPLIVDKLSALDRDRQIEINDPKTLREMLQLRHQRERQDFAGQPLHDDCVISLAIAAHIHEGRWIPSECPEELYVEASKEYWMCSGPSCATSRSFA
jgi:hypothetical protein